MQITSFPLHPAQHDVYTDQLLNNNSPLYNVGGYIELKGALDKEVFFEVINSAPRVFDVLKTRFDFEAADFLCYVDEGYEKFEMEELDFSGHISANDAALEWMQNRFNTPFVFTPQTLLFEHFLIKVNESKYFFFGRYHHLITDGYGFIVWVKYVADKYKALLARNGLEFKFPSYKDYALEATAYKGSKAYEQEVNYWLERINKKPDPLLQRRSQKVLASKKNSSYTFNLTFEQKSKLDALQSITSAGLQQLTIAALLIYFSKTSGVADVTFGIPIHKRGSKKLRSIMGMFSGFIPFKGNYNESQLLSDLLKDIVNHQKQDYRHHNFYTSDLNRQLKINSTENSLFEVVINYEAFNFQLDFGDNLQANIYQLTSNATLSPLQFCWKEFGNNQQVQLQVDYWNDYFNGKEIELLVQRVLFILEQFSTRLNAAVRDIDILPPNELTLIEHFNNTKVSYPKDKTIIDLFEEQVIRTPTAPAIIFESDQITFEALNEKANQLAYYLKEKGVEQETLVPVCIERSPEMIVALLGILKAGAAYVPIDPTYPTERITYMLEDTAATIVVTNSKSKARLQAREGTDLIELDIISAELAAKPSNNLNVDIAADNLAYVIYTSGSTGKPKGVMIEHQSAYTFICWCKDEFANSNFQTVYASTSICFDLSVYEIFYPLAIGKKIRLLENGLHIPNYLSEDTAVLTNSVPVVVEHLLKEKTDLSNITVMNMAGEPIPLHVQQGLDTERIEVRNLYGPTEDTTYSTVYRLRKDEPLLIGKPISNTTIYIQSANKELAPIGVAGEICIGGSGLARGYLNRPALTAERFISNPFSEEEGSRLYKTGDLGRWLPDGNIEYLGRIDDQVKIRGFRIELGEIENVLIQSGLVDQAAVVAKADDTGNKVLVGYVVSAQILEKRTIITYLENKLPSYMVPAVWVQLESLPLNSNGKIDRKSLPDADLSQLLNDNYEAPQNEVEARLVEIWQELLGVESIGVNDNFFELGGHSLKAIQLISKIHKQLNFKVDIGTVIGNPTISQLARKLTQQVVTQFEGIPKVAEQETYELSHAQKRFWILSQFADGLTAYNGVGAYKLTGHLNVNVFNSAFNFLIQRHESLRTVFIQVEGEPRQKILPSSEINFQVELIDLNANTQKDAIIKEAIEKEAAFIFDLTNAPLLRGKLVKIADDSFVFVFNIHHIISDGWSKSIFLNEFLATYQNIISNSSSTLAPLAIQYKDYAAWHHTTFAKQSEYWKSLYEDNVPVLNFPADFERPKVVSYVGAIVEAAISKDLTRQLKRLAALQGMTFNNLLFAAYAMLVTKYSKQEDVVIGSLTSGRSHSDLEALIGVFINFLPVRLSTKKELSLKEYLKQAQESLVAAYNNQDYPFDLMVEECISKRDISRNPFFDTMINFHPNNDLTTFASGNSTLKDSVAIERLELKEKGFQSVLDFKVDVEPVDDYLNLNLSYNTKLFVKERMVTFLDHFIKLLEELVNEEELSLEDYLKGETFLEGAVPERKSDIGVTQLPINICASFVVEPVEEYIEYWSNELELNLKVNFAPYNQVFQQLLNPQSLLNAGSGLNVLFIRIEDWLRDQKDLSVGEQINFLNKNYRDVVLALETARSYNNTPYLIGLVPLYSPHLYATQVVEIIHELFKNLESLLEKQPSFHIIDLNNIAELYEVTDVFDAVSDKLGHMPFTQEFYGALGTYIARKACAFKGPPYKVIAVDCDNTLWKGIVGEVGTLGVIIDEHFTYLQDFLIEKYKEGFLLVLCSKNNEDDVWEVFEKHPNMKLKRDHVAAHKINWQPKPENIVSIAKELNLGLDSFIFLDDNEFEIEQMSASWPEVFSVVLPEESEAIPGFLNHIWAFDLFQITDEDVRRNSMYQAEKERKLEQVKFGTINDFLEALNIEVETRPLEEKDLERAVQLSLRTNQFNLNGVRKTREEILASLLDQDSIQWIIEVKDRFGEYGIVGLLIGKKKRDAFILESFMLSCRVLGRRVENIVLDRLKAFCSANGCDIITALFQPTNKNKPFTEFLGQTDWVQDQQSTSYSLSVKYSDQELSYTNNEKQLS